MIKKLLIGFALLLVALVVSGIYVKGLLLPASNDNNQVDFLIPKGTSVSLIGRNLEKEGLIKSATAFKIFVQLTNSQNKIQAGEFVLSPNLSLTQIVNELKKGPKEVWVTVPEGLRREEIALKFKDSLVKDDTFLQEFLKLTLDKEGYLFPDTYLFPKTASATQIVTKLSSTFETKVKEVTFEQVIMASMLERETFADSEKPIVAGVLYKRLKNGWPLQVDATLQYAVANSKCQITNYKCDYWEQVAISNKTINSPYNTYENLGLPPAPIANAGQTSINAAINPEESDYWYYIHDNDGKIHFAKTLEEHNQNITKYLK